MVGLSGSVKYDRESRFRERDVAARASIGHKGKGRTRSKYWGVVDGGDVDGRGVSRNQVAAGAGVAVVVHRQRQRGGGARGIGVVDVADRAGARWCSSSALTCATVPVIVTDERAGVGDDCTAGAGGHRQRALGHRQRHGHGAGAGVHVADRQAGVLEGERDLLGCRSSSPA